MSPLFFVFFIIRLEMSVLKNIVSYLWQLPQNMLGLVFLAYLHRTSSVIRSSPETVIRVSREMRGGISLGRYIFINSYNATGDTIAHECGHGRQSRILGPAYLSVVGIPSLLWAAFHPLVAAKVSYYRFYTERWADKLGGVER